MMSPWSDVAIEGQNSIPPKQADIFTLKEHYHMFRNFTVLIKPCSVEIYILYIKDALSENVFGVMIHPMT
jgi:hypothetical protein